jgi:chaperonin cofactor prefoldin
MSRAKIEEDEEEMEIDEDEMDEMDEGMDMFEALGSLLATEDGETIATTLVGLKDATEKIAQCMEMQNKILVKILSAMSAVKPCACPPTPTPA